MLITLCVTAFAAYFVGSVPTGFLMARANGIDIRTTGSGNIGATNVFRILGATAGVVVLLVDGLKGYLGCTLGLVMTSAGWLTPVEDPNLLRIVGALGAVLGHNYTFWLKFKGGKGIATSAGALIALMTKPFLVIFAVWLLAFGVTRFVSLASVLAAAALPIAAWWFRSGTLLICVATLMSALAIYKHRGNIQRLLAGTEPRVGNKRGNSTLK